MAPRIPSSGSINLLEQLVGLRFYLLDYWFVLKDYSSGIAGVRQAQGRCGDGVGIPRPPQVLPAPQMTRVQHGSSQNPYLPGFMGLHDEIMSD